MAREFQEKEIIPTAKRNPTGERVPLGKEVPTDEFSIDEVIDECGNYSN